MPLTSSDRAVPDYHFVNEAIEISGRYTSTRSDLDKSVDNMEVQATKSNPRSNDSGDEDQQNVSSVSHPLTRAMPTHETRSTAMRPDIQGLMAVLQDLDAEILEDAAMISDLRTRLEKSASTAKEREADLEASLKQEHKRQQMLTIDVLQFICRIVAHPIRPVDITAFKMKHLRTTISEIPTLREEILGQFLRFSGHSDSLATSTAGDGNELNDAATFGETQIRWYVEHCANLLVRWAKGLGYGTTHELTTQVKELQRDLVDLAAANRAAKANIQFWKDTADRQYATVSSLRRELDALKSGRLQRSPAAAKSGRREAKSSPQVVAQSSLGTDEPVRPQNSNPWPLSGDQMSTNTNTAPESYVPTTSVLSRHRCLLAPTPAARTASGEPASKRPRTSK
ncbi:hypothetical protein LTR84_009857 [Exophiala bonariae]|uniref:Ubinuclein middle domain-containing protein n=1 Tax=Exophiala bonariae TaxID=1690606 RepID=A0AAV9NKL4_9EURO|nr:hypothetical protein LTR84_009857 [Exophiala bonariae]